MDPHSGEIRLDEKPEVDSSTEVKKVKNEIKPLDQGKETKTEANPNLSTKPHPIHFYTSLSRSPEGVSFETQDRDEEIILLVRRSFVTNVPWILFAVLLSLLPVILPFLPLGVLFEDVRFTTYLLFVLFFYLFIFGFVLTNFTLWYFHVALVTNKRIIDVDLNGILSRDVAETRISLVQDVTYQQIGFFRSIFGFGDVFVQTAGSEQNIQFDRAPRPAFIAQAIGDLVGKRAHKAK